MELPKFDFVLGGKTDGENVDGDFATEAFPQVGLQRIQRVVAKRTGIGFVVGVDLHIAGQSCDVIGFHGIGHGSWND